MRLAVFRRWPHGAVLPEQAAGDVVAEATDGSTLLGIHFTNASGENRQRPELLAGVSARQTFVGVEIGDTGAGEVGKILFLVTFRVPREDQGEFDSWYETEHVARLMEIPGWLRCRRYAVADHGTSPTRVALHELQSLAALDSPVRAAAGASRWRQELATRPWFATGTFETFRRLRPTSSPAER
jgi:hypothetical protein